MATAYYMTFTRGHHGSASRVGGQPTMLPKLKPWSLEDEQYFGFVLQLKVESFWIDLPDVEYIQLYQPVDDGDDPLPVVVVIPRDSPKNVSGDVIVHPLARPWDIGFEIAEDPIQLPKLDLSPSTGKIFKSKLRGLDPWQKHLDRVFLGQIHQEPAGLNFAGMVCSLYLENHGAINAELS